MASGFSRAGLGCWNRKSPTCVRTHFCDRRPTLTNAVQILQLTPEQADANLPVRINGVVTCYDHGRVLFVQDETAGVFVYHTGDRLPLQPGQHVQVTGLAKPGRYSPFIDSPVIQTLKSGPAISPQQVSSAQVQHGGLDSQWVEVTGVIRAQKLKRQPTLVGACGFATSHPCVDF